MKRYFDPRLILFVLLGGGASIIAAHGTWIFFGALVDPWLAGIFVTVVALGIIGLDAAGTLETGWRRVPYYAGMVVFLLLETLANYFSAQAGFVARIGGKLAADSDLLTITQASPAWTRALVVLFLSTASIAVALFTFAAATRFAQLRSGAADRPRALLGRLRKRYSAVVRALRTLRMQSAQTIAELRSQLDLLRTEASSLRGSAAEQSAELDLLRTMSARAEERSAGLEIDLRGELDQVRGQADRLRAELDRAEATAAALRIQSARDLEIVRSELDRVRTEAEQLRTQSAAAEAAAADLHMQSAAEQRQLRTAHDEAERLRAQLAERSAAAAKLSAELEALSAASKLDIRQVAQALRDLGVSLRTIGEALGVSEKTIRNWTHDVAAANGHTKEAI